MIRVAFAIAVAAVGYTAVLETTQASPVGPLPATVTNDPGNVTPVYYRGGYYRYRWHGAYYHHRYWRHHRWYYY